MSVDVELSAFFLNAPVILSTPSRATVAHIKNSVKLGASFVMNNITKNPTSKTIHPKIPQTLLLDNLP